jgi:hypothetical protein
MLREIRRELQATVPLTLLVGGALGAGLIHLMIDRLDLGTNASLETLMRASLEIFAPVSVNLIWISASAAPRVGAAVLVERRLRFRDLAAGIGSAAGCAILLLPYFVGATLVVGVLATSNPEPAAQIPPLLALLTPETIGGAVARTGLFAAASAALCQWQGSQRLANADELPRRISDAIVCCFLAVIGFEALWFAILPPPLVGPG